MRFRWPWPKPTVVATDIVGSTPVLLELGDRAWREAIETHNEIVRYHLRRHEGVEVAWRGDGFLMTFDSPDNAIVCACILSLDVERLRLSVRVGIGLGPCRVRDGNCSGPGVSAALAIMDRAAPGEVLATADVAAAADRAGSAVREIDGVEIHVLDRLSVVN